MKVIAIKVGYYGGKVRQIGEVFPVPEGSKASWFVPAESDSTEPKKGNAEPKKGKADKPDDLV